MVVKIISPHRYKRKRVESPRCFPEGRGFFCLTPIDPNSRFVTRSPTLPGSSIRLWANRAYTVGRDRRSCEIAFVEGRCVSKRHCQFFLDGFRRKLVVVDGSMDSSEMRSLNGVFVNGRRIEKGAIFEVFTGDVVSLACDGHGMDGRWGFVVEKIVFLDACDGMREGSDDISMGLGGNELRYRKLIERALMLRSLCRSILCSVDPVLYVRRSLDVGILKRKRVEGEVHGGSLPDSRICNRLPSDVAVRLVDKEVVNQGSLLERTTLGSPPSDDVVKLVDMEEDKFCCLPDIQLQHQSVSPDPSGNESLNDGKKVSCAVGLGEHTDKNESILQTLQDDECNIPSDGRMLFLNRLLFMDPKSSEHRKTVSLPELLQPVRSLVRVFIATFTCDVSWFLSYCKMPNHLPITIACHDTKRCWDSSSESRTSMPLSEYPNLVLLYPPFPESTAFGMDRKKRGVGCHHPKLFVLQREDYIRIIITSANLVSRQWNNVTNTVWWQDFPRRDRPDIFHLFSRICNTGKDEDPRNRTSDFAAQLAGFMASLIAGVPKEAYWILELTKYNFSGAVGHLVASVPGIHVQNSPSEPNYILSLTETVQSKYSASSFVGQVQASVVGINHHFRAATDTNGSELKTLASLLWKDTFRMQEVLLIRSTNIPADANAVSVVVSKTKKGSKEASVHLGFLSRDVAKWVAPLSDMGLFSFSAFILPKEALAAAFEGSNIKVHLILYISQGPKFSQISSLLQPELFPSLCSLLASLGRCRGLSRLQEILCRYNWPESLESDFVYGCSSIGTSICPQYLASFSAATGKRSHQLSDSEESDPEWGRWTTEHEIKHPSLSILFPTIERVKAGPCGVQSCRYMLAFSEKTWQRLRSMSILHDAIPNPPTREGYPMHIKVACRRFQCERDSSSFGWIYCGSHNFSPAAWGQSLQSPATKSYGSETSTIGSMLRICNYELGIIFVIPPPKSGNCVESSWPSLDDISLPFLLPAPQYKNCDRPATTQAMREVAILLRESYAAQQAVEEDELDEEISDEDEECVEYVAEENKEEKIYAEMLWSQLDSSEGP